MVRWIAMRTFALAVLASTHLAHAQPDSCAALRPLPWKQLSSYAQKRLESGDGFEHRKDYPKLTVEVIVQRAQHIARAALASCPGVTVESTMPLDPKRQTSAVMVKVDSFAALSRMAQLPAVETIVVSAPRDQRIRHPFPPTPAVLER